VEIKSAASKSFPIIKPASLIHCVMVLDLLT